MATFKPPWEPPVTFWFPTGSSARIDRNCDVMVVDFHTDLITDDVTTFADAHRQSIFRCVDIAITLGPRRDVDRFLAPFDIEQLVHLMAGQGPFVMHVGYAAGSTVVLEDVQFRNAEPNAASDVLHLHFTAYSQPTTVVGAAPIPFRQLNTIEVTPTKAKPKRMTVKRREL